MLLSSVIACGNMKPKLKNITATRTTWPNMVFGGDCIFCVIVISYRLDHLKKARLGVRNSYTAQTNRRNRLGGDAEKNRRSVTISIVLSFVFLHCVHKPGDETQCHNQHNCQSKPHVTSPPFLLRYRPQKETRRSASPGPFSRRFLNVILKKRPLLDFFEKWPRKTDKRYAAGTLSHLELER